MEWKPQKLPILISVTAKSKIAYLSSLFIINNHCYKFMKFT